MEKNNNEEVGLRGAKLVKSSTGSINYRSTYDNAEKWNKENMENIRVRVPKGSKVLIQEYVKNNKDKYRSINSLIVTLLEKELGCKLEKNVPE